MVTFQNWVAHSGKTQEVIAKQLGVSRAYVSQLVAHKKTPSLRMIGRILLIANGSLNAEDLLYEFTVQRI